MTPPGGYVDHFPEANGTNGTCIQSVRGEGIPADQSHRWGIQTCNVPSIRPPFFRARIDILGGRQIWYMMTRRLTAGNQDEDSKPEKRNVRPHCGAYSFCPPSLRQACSLRGYCSNIGRQRPGCSHHLLPGIADTFVSVPFTRPPEFIASDPTRFRKHHHGDLHTRMDSNSIRVSYAAGAQPKHYYALIAPGGGEQPKKATLTSSARTDRTL